MMRYLLALPLIAGLALNAYAQPTPPAGGGGTGTGANPTATAGSVAINGSATTFMRSDGAPAVQLGSAGQFGIIKCDGSTITCASGVISVTAGGGSPGTPGGSTNALQYNAGGGSFNGLGLGTTTTILHGNAGGLATWGAVALGSDVTGNLPLANMASLGANVILGTTVSGTPVALSMPNCGGASNALTFVSGTGIGCNTIAGGGGSLTVTDGTTSVTSTTSLTLGNGFVVSGSGGSATVTQKAPNNTYSSNHALAAADMGGQTNMNGASLTLTIPAISSTVNATGMQWVAMNQAATPVTISTTPTINGYIGSVIPGGGGIACTSNGVSLDCLAIGTTNNPTTYAIGTVSSGTSTINCLRGPLQYLTNGGAFTFAAPAADSACVVQVENNGSAGAITFSGFSQGSNSGDALTTTNTNKFQIAVTRINGSSHYLVTALQ